MKNFTTLFSVFIFCIGAISCNFKNKEKTPIFIQKEVLDSIFSNKYEAMIPCPDCTGIETTLRFYSDSTVVRTVYYEDKNLFPERKIGTWKLQDSIFITSFDKDKLFYKIKSGSKILRVGADFKEVEGDLASAYVFKRDNDTNFDAVLGKYIVGDTLGDFRELQIAKIGKDVYSIHFIGAQKTDSVRYCQYQLKGKINAFDELTVNLNKISDTLKGELKLVFTKGAVHAMYDNVSGNSLPNFCKKQISIPIEGSYKKSIAL